MNAKPEKHYIIAEVQAKAIDRFYKQLLRIYLFANQSLYNEPKTTLTKSKRTSESVK